jgi:RNA polymerase sigma factor (sigma-70 family)
MSETATVYVVDDDTSVRRSLRRLLRSANYRVEDFASAEEFLQRQSLLGTGCVLLDVRMPRMSGPELFERMGRLGIRLPVIFLTAHGDVPTSVRAMKQGAVDFLLKPADSGQLRHAIDEAIARHAAQREADDEVALVLERVNRLSAREREVMEHVVQGEPNKRIASALGISEKTVKVHRHRVMEKMEAGSLAELVRLADSVLAGAAAGTAAPVPSSAQSQDRHG